MSRILRNLETKAFVSPVPMVAALAMHSIRKIEERDRTYTSKPKRKRKAKAKAPKPMAVTRSGYGGQALRGSVFDVRKQRTAPRPGLGGTAVPGSVFDVRPMKAGRSRGRR